MDAIAHRASEARRIAGEGSPARFWPPWLAARGVVHRTPADVVGAGRRLVVVAPHPDDEILACGALLHAHMAAGGAAAIVAVTDGEASHAADGSWNAAALGALRRDESARGLRELGAAQVPVERLGLPDGRVAAREAALARQLSRLLRTGDVVVTTWRLDGHPDHEACGRAAATACAEHSCRLLEAPVWMWHWARPGHPQIPWPMLCAVDASAGALACKARALARHASQLAPRAAGQPPVLGRSIRERAGWSAEYFFTRP